MIRYQLGLYEKAMPSTLTWKEKFREAKKAGFDYIEISIDESDEKLKRLDFTDEQIEAILDIAQSENMCLGSMCLSGHRKYPLGSTDPDTRKRSLEIMDKACALAVKLGIRYIQLAGYDVYYDESTEKTRKLFAENLKTSAQIAASYGVLLGFETMETPFMDTVSKSMEYVNLIDSPYLNVYPDIGNLNNASIKYGADVIADINSGNGRIIAAHIKETKPGHYREIPFTTGVVDFDKLIGCCWKNGARRFVTELWYVGQENWRDDIKFASDFARNILNKQSN